MARQDKVDTVAEITDRFRSSAAAVLTDYRGLSVAQLKELRRSLGGAVTFSVVKNTLTRRAAAEAGIEGFEDLLVGPSAIAFVDGDPVEAAKGIRDFAKVNPDLVVKGGYMDGAILTPQDFAKFADLESREVLLAKLAGMMKAKQSQAASLFAAPLAQAARALGALQAKVEADAPTSGSTAEPPAAEDTSADGQDVADQGDAVQEEASQEDAISHDSSPNPDAPEADAEPAAEAEETTEG
ncbi:MAG: 50S ribosomal protein L10 [Actinomycetales bacterium]|nr:50S ribosomal protein L10 [Actinomycetales bacterium]